MKKQNLRKLINIIALLGTISVLLWCSLKLMIPCNSAASAASAASDASTEILKPENDDIVLHAPSPVSCDTMFMQEQKLDTLYSSIFSSISELNILYEEIEEIHYNVFSAKTCSKVNRFFNMLDEKFNRFENLLALTNSHIVSYHETYEALLSNADSYNALVQNPDEQHIVSSISPLEIDMNFNAQNYSQKALRLDSFHTVSKLLADAFYERDFYWACAAAQNEAGYEHWPPEERYFVLNVGENRSESEDYPHTLKDVFSESGQYPWFERGCADIPRSETILRDVEYYLRGNVDTGMPETVVYQSKQKLGETWYYSPISGHYFCSPYDSK